MKRLLLVLAVFALVLTAVALPSSAAPDESQNYKLFGGMQRALDPENSNNEVISSTISPANYPNDGFFAGAYRKLGVQVPQLDNMVQTKYYFTASRSCGGGSPRIVLSVDLNGDNRPEADAWGYIGQPFNFTGCQAGTWQFEDLTDNNPRWDLSPFNSFCNANPGACPTRSGFVIPWSEVETFFAAFPNHKVVSGALVDDVYPGSPAGQGTAYYDNVTIGKRTLDGWEDTTK